jgi:hypothetical protein
MYELILLLEKEEDLKKVEETISKTVVKSKIKKNGVKGFWLIQ